MIVTRMRMGFLFYFILKILPLLPLHGAFALLTPLSIDGQD